MGAPPDLFNTQGQNWGLPPFVPHRLQEARYEPFIEIVRAGLRHAGGLRIDHVIGLFRSFWIPYGFDAKDGAYVRYPVEDLLGILALESQRAGALIIGEDLGTVEPGTRERLAAHDILSYALLYFESAPPSEFPPKALAAITTHDLPTIAGLWSGSDLAEQIALASGTEPRKRTVAARAAGALDRSGAECVDRRGDSGRPCGIGPGAIAARGRHAGGCLGRGGASEHSQHHHRPTAELDAGVAGAAR